MFFKCYHCSSWYKTKTDYDLLIKNFKNTYEFCNKDMSRFLLLLRKGVYP